MCQQCLDALHELFPDLSDEQQGEILIILTAFPFAKPETIREQLEHVRAIGLPAAFVEAQNAAEQVTDNTISAEAGCWNCNKFTFSESSPQPTAYTPGTKYKGYCPLCKGGETYHVMAKMPNFALPVCNYNAWEQK
jgi:hypothetical protein